MNDLWSDRRAERLAAAEPLAFRMRPRTLDEFAGQRHILGPGTLLRRALEADRITSLLFYGPPGTGKTTLAELIAAHTKRRFERANAAAVGVREVRDVIARATDALSTDGQRTIFFLDEIHRFSRAQQDVLLGDVERGVLTLIGATTENPFFSVNPALVSRSQVFRFEPLDEQDIVDVLRRAIDDADRGLGKIDLAATDDALGLLATTCDGDARRALTALEIAALSQTPDDAGKITIDRHAAEQSIQRKAPVYGRDGDQHYDVISAFIKSVRGSDPDAAIYWLARMLDAGEDPLFIARRIAILASEDIGNADPRALSIAAAAYDITHRIGLPECRITLAQATTYLASAPKSNASYAAINAAMDDVKHERTIPVPVQLMSASRTEKERTGHGTGYQYAHNAEGGVSQETYLGVDKTYYTPTDRGYEQRIADYLTWAKSLRAPANEDHREGRGDAETRRDN